MKKLIFFFLLLLTCAAVNAQNRKAIKTGRFRIPPDNTSPTESIITRTSEHQYEDVPSQGIKLQFTLKWTSDCSYELRNPKVIKGEMPGVSADHILYVKIIKVTPLSYTAEITASFADFKLLKDIQIISK